MQGIVCNGLCVFCMLFGGGGSHMRKPLVSSLYGIRDVWEVLSGIFCSYKVMHATVLFLSSSQEKEVWCLKNSSYPLSSVAFFIF